MSPEEGGDMLNFTGENVRYLVRKKLLTSLGLEGGRIWLAKVEIEEKARDLAWLCEATRLIQFKDQDHNSKYGNNGQGGESSAPAATD